MENYHLNMYAKGTAFSEGIYDLRSLELLVSNYRAILDGLLAVQLGRRRLTPTLRKQIDYEVVIKPGSIDFLVNLAMQHKELLVAAALHDGGYQLSSLLTTLFREAINLRSLVADAIKKGIHINININNNVAIGKGNVVAQSDSGDITVFDPKVLWAAQVTKNPTDRLITGVDGSQIEFIELKSRDDEIRVDSGFRAILGQNREELSATIEIMGRLDMISFSGHRGSIISENDRYPVTWDESIREKMQRIADVEGVLFTVKPIIDTKRLHSNAIAYHVVDCIIPQQDLEL